MRLYRRQQARKAKRQAAGKQVSTPQPAGGGPAPQTAPTEAPQPAPAQPQRKSDPVVDYLLGDG
jgi:hypothetical protein